MKQGEPIDGQNEARIEPGLESGLETVPVRPGIAKGLELAGLVLATLLAWLWASYCRGLGHLKLPVGADAWMWGLSALDLEHGMVPILPPGFPAVLSVFARLGLSLTREGLYASQIAFSLTPAVVYLAVRQAGGARAGAAFACLLCVLSPDLLGAGLTFQPEAWTVFAMALYTATVATHLKHRSWWSLGGVALASTWLALVREHGLAALPIILLIVALQPPISRRAGADEPPRKPGLIRRLMPRFAAMALVLCVVHLGPLLLGMKLLTPITAWPWNEKASVPMHDLERIYKSPDIRPSYLRGTVIAEAGVIASPQEARRVVQDYEGIFKEPDSRRRLLDSFRLNWRWSRALSADLHTWMIVGLLSLLAFAVYRRRPALLLIPMLELSIIPSLFLWSQRRHVIVVLPIVFFGVGLGLSLVQTFLENRLVGEGSRRSSARHVYLPAVLTALLGVVLGGVLQWQWAPRQSQNLSFLLRSSREHAIAIRFGQELAARRAPGQRYFSTNLMPPDGEYVALGAELPRIAFHSGRELGGSMLPALQTGWREYIVVPTRQATAGVGEGWKRILEQDGLSAWAYRPDVKGEERRCLEGVPLEIPRYFVLQGPASSGLSDQQVQGPASGCETKDGRRGPG